MKLLDNTKMLRGSRFYTKPLDASNVPSLAEGSTKIIVKNDDSIHCGHQLQQEGYNPVVLNLASRRNPGGGVKNGSRAQEESLFRSTNLFLSCIAMRNMPRITVWRKASSNIRCL